MRFNPLNTLPIKLTAHARTQEVTITDNGSGLDPDKLTVVMNLGERGIDQHVLEQHLSELGPAQREVHKCTRKRVCPRAHARCANMRACVHYSIDVAVLPAHIWQDRTIWRRPETCIACTG